MISRADFYALGSIKSLETSTTETVDRFTGRSVFAVGQSDCSSSPTENAANDFPISTQNLAETLAYFNAYFRYSPNQVVALLGTHTLGKARIENSGYEGRWVDRNGGTNLGPASTLNNEYYINPRNRPWIQVEITRSSDNKKLKQWQIPLPGVRVMQVVDNTGSDRARANQPSIMFHSDACFLAEFTVTNSTGTTNCNLRPPIRQPPPAFNCCPYSSTVDLVGMYAQSNSQWITDFTSIFMDMIARNDNLLTPLANLPSGTDEKN